MKRVYGLFSLALVLAVLIAALPGMAVLAQSDPLVCSAFVGSAADVRTGYYMGEGVGYFQAGQLGPAIDSFSCVIQETDSSYVPAYLSRAGAFSARHEYEKAVADYTAAIQRDGSNIPAYNNRGIVYAAQGEYELAEADFDRILELDGDNVLALSNRGVVRAIQGEYSDAIADLEEAIDIAGTEAIIAELRNPEREDDAPPLTWDADHAQAYATLGIVYSSFALENYDKYLLLAGNQTDDRIRGAAGALESRFTFELRLDDGSWLLTAAFSPTEP